MERTLMKKNTKKSETDGYGSDRGLRSGKTQTTGCGKIK